MNALTDHSYSSDVKKMLTNPITWVKSIFSVIFLSSVLAIIPVASNLTLQFTAPVTYWLDFVKLNSTKEFYKVGERLTFESIRVVHRPIDVIWAVRLICDSHNGNGYVTYSIHNASRYGIPPAGEHSVIWTYQAFAPDTVATCYAESTAIVQLQIGHKTTTQTSNKFLIVN